MTEIPAIELVSSTEQVFLEQLIDGHAVVAGDIVQIASDSWVIHGLVHDGEDVMMTKFPARGLGRSTVFGESLTAGH